MQIPIPSLSEDSLHSLHGIPQTLNFQECSVTVASEVPLNDIINNREATGRIAKWAIELLPFEIIYKPRQAIKSQVLANFVVE